MLKIKKLLSPYKYKIRLLVIKYEIWVKMLAKSSYNKVEIRIYETVIADLKKLTKQQ